MTSASKLPSMTLESIPKFIRESYHVKEWRHASTLLQRDFAKEWEDIVGVLTTFRLYKSEISEKGGNKSPPARRIDGGFYERDWKERGFETAVIVDAVRRDTPTHSVDCFRNRVAVEVEWNNKDPFFDRDLNNFRLLFDLHAISVGVIITRGSELQEIFNTLGKGKSYGNNTTHWNQLIPRIEGGGGAGYPIIAFGITPALYVDSDETPPPFVDSDETPPPLPFGGRKSSKTGSKPTKIRPRQPPEPDSDE